MKIKNLSGKHSKEPRQVPFLSDLSALFCKFHDEKGHPGRDAMLADMKSLFGWFGMKKDLESYSIKEPLRSIVASKPRERGVFDLTELPEDPTTNNRYIFGIIDAFSRKVWAVALPLSKKITSICGNPIMEASFVLPRSLPLSRK